MKPAMLKEYVEMLFDRLGQCRSCDYLFRNAKDQNCCWVDGRKRIRNRVDSCTAYKEHIWDWIGRHL